MTCMDNFPYRMRGVDSTNNFISIFIYLIGYFLRISQIGNILTNSFYIISY